MVWFSVLLVIPIITVILLSLVLTISIRKRDKYFWNIKSPPRLPLIGNGLMFFKKPAPQILRNLHSAVKEHGRVVKFWLLNDVIIVVTDPKISEVILSSQKLITKSNEYDFLRNWLGDGLLISTGKKWFGRRKAITPTFHFKILEQFVEIFDKQSNIFVNVLKKYKSDEPVDIYPLVTLAALDVICESAMGTSANAQINTDSEYVRAVKDISNVLHLRMFDFLLRSDFFFRMSFSAIKERKAVKVLHDFTDSVIIARRAELLSKQDTVTEENKEDEDLGLKKKSALLDVLLQSTIDGKPLSNRDIREEVDTFMFEGHDTTTSGISFALYNIAKNPKVQQRLVEEIRSVIGDDVNKPITLQMLNNLHYLDLVIKETLRLYPSVPLFGRKTSEETHINDLTIPKGTSVVIGTFFMNRDPEFFPNPEEFLPERFIGDRTVESLNPYTYVPFSAGPRNCIGQKFAVLELKSMISKVLRHYELGVDPSYNEPVLIAELILRPENGIVLNLKRRKW